MKTGSAVFLLLLICWRLNAQDFDLYQTIVPAGPVPRDFTEKSFVKVASEVKNISGSRNRRAKSTFYLESTFSIDDFLSGGAVLFNDPVSLYLRKVLEEVVRPFPHLHGRIRIYAVKSAVVNAFTTNNGIIFVNLGLLSRLENEAQLAFVIAHEVVHYEKQHVLNAYIHSVDIDRASVYRDLPNEVRGFAKSSYSKELESEADFLGSDIFLRSGYNTDSVSGIFNILRYADHPVSLSKFDKKVFESDRYAFHDSLSVAVREEQTPDDDYDDSGSSHPNIRKRKEAVEKKLKAKPGGKAFLVSQQEFLLAGKISRYELVRIYLLDHQYLHSLNLALDLLRESPSSRYLQQAVAKSLYGIAQIRSRKELHVDPDEWSAESLKLTTFISRLSTFETGVLAMRMLYKSLERSPAPGVELMLRDLIRTMSSDTDLNGKFIRPASKTATDPSKYRYTQFAFADLENAAAFFEMLDGEALAIAQAKKRRSARPFINTGDREREVRKIVVVNPRYKKVDRRKKQRSRLIQSEKMVIDINEKIHASAGRLDLMSEILNVNTLTTTDARTMQSNSLLNDWLQEQFRSGENRMISPIYDEIVDVARIHKTDHFLWLGCLSVIEKKRGKGYVLAPAIALPSVAPLGLAYLVSPKGKTYYFALLFNVRTQELELTDVRAMSMKDSGSLLESNIFYTLFKLKQMRE